MPTDWPVTEHVLETARHRSAYLRCGPDDGPLAVLVHGWPERAISWRGVMPHLAASGWLVLAPDMRGYGGSTVHLRQQDYAMEEVVLDLLELADSTGRERALWIGHDWGSPAVWSLASHHPYRCLAVANLCVPYLPGGFVLDEMIPLVDRDLYPEDEFPAGQWDYFLYYRERFEEAQAAFEADVSSTVRLLFRAGDPASVGQRAPTATVRARGGWFGPGAAPAPSLPMDTSVLDEDSLATYVSGLERNGFFGPDSWYVNDERNARFAGTSVDGGRLSMPVLFLHARYDTVCATVGTRLADPMREACAALTEVVVDSGHWMAQERPDDVNAALDAWLAGVHGVPAR